MKAKFKRLRGLILLLLLMVLSANSKFLMSVASESERSINKDNIATTSNVVLEKYINYEDGEQKGLLVQYSVDAGIEYKNNENYVPLAATGILINAPKIENEFPTNVEIIAKSTLLTNGSNKGKDYKFVYKKETGEIAIVTSNNKNEEGRIYEEYKQNAKDNFSIILNYGEKAYNSENKETNLEVTGKVAAVLNAEEKIRITSDFENATTAKENISKLVSTKVQNTKVYNGYIKSNAVNGTNYETTYKENVQINISKENLGEQKIGLTQKFINKESKEIEATNLVFKTSKIEKQSIIDILGEEGSLKILTSQEELLAEINKDTQNNEDGTINIDYPEGTTGLILELSNAQKVGNITIQNEKAITAQEKNTELAKIQETYNQDEITNIEIQDSKTEVTIEPSQTTWTNEKQNEVEFTINLHNNSNKYNLFKNPVIAIQLPEETEKVLLNEKATLTNANGLKIKNIDYNQENRTIKVELEGEQTKYLSPALEDGTIIKIPAIIILSDSIESKEIELKSAYQNENSYTGKTETEVLKNNIILENFNQSLIPNDTIQTMTRRLTSAGPTRGVEATAQGISISVNPVIGDVTRDTVYEGEFIKYEITATNTTEQDLENVKVIATLPEGVTYGELVREDNEPYVPSYYDFEKQLQPIELGTIKSGENATTYFEVKVNDLAEGEIQKQITTIIKAFVGESLSDEKEVTHQVEKANYNLFLSSSIYLKNQFQYRLNIESDIEDDENIMPVIVKLPKCMEVTTVRDNSGFAGVSVEYEEINNDENIISFNAKPGIYNIYTKVINSKIDKEEDKSSIEIAAIAKLNDGDKEYKSNENRILLQYEAVTISMTSPNAGEMVRVNDEIDYEIKVKNIGKVNYNTEFSCVNVKISDYLPNYLEPIDITYNYFEVNEQEKTYTPGEEEITENIYSNDELGDENSSTKFELPLKIPYNETITIKVRTKAKTVSEKTQIENRATVSENVVILGDNETQYVYNSTFDSKTSNIITHTILPANYVEPTEPDNPEQPDDPDQPDLPDQPDNPDQPDEPEQPEVNKYSLNGYVWNDENEDGEKQNNEQLLSEIKTYLLNTKGEVVKETKTDNNGKYDFVDIDDGEYNVVFKYNQNQYRITKFKANGVSESSNSNATKQDVVINGEKITAGVTEQITLNKNIENINLGLIENKKFDFKVENYISKITVKTKSGTTETPYSKTNLAKTEIRAKEIEGAVVTVEYKIVVTNNGELPGKVERVVDYLPKGLNIAPESTSSWNSNINGTFINTSLANQIIEAGNSVELTLVATRTMTEDSTGILTNKVIIEGISNELKIEEINTNNNISGSEIILSISTGLDIIISLIVLIIIGIIIVLNQKHNIFKNMKIKIFSVILVMFMISAGYMNILSHADNAISEIPGINAPVEIQTLFLWNDVKHRWRFDLGDQAGIEKNIYVFDSSKPIKTGKYLQIPDRFYVFLDQNRIVYTKGRGLTIDDIDDIDFAFEHNTNRSYGGGTLYLYNKYDGNWNYIRNQLSDIEDHELSNYYGTVKELLFGWYPQFFWIDDDWKSFGSLNEDGSFDNLFKAECTNYDKPANPNGGYEFNYNIEYAFKDPELVEEYLSTHPDIRNWRNQFYDDRYNGEVNRYPAHKYRFTAAGDDVADNFYNTEYSTYSEYNAFGNSTTSNEGSVVPIKKLSDGNYLMGPFKINSSIERVKKQNGIITTRTNDNNYNISYSFEIKGTGKNSGTISQAYNSSGGKIDLKNKENVTFYLKVTEQDLKNYQYIYDVCIYEKVDYTKVEYYYFNGQKKYHRVNDYDTSQVLPDIYQVPADNTATLYEYSPAPKKETIKKTYHYYHLQGNLSIHKEDELGVDENGNKLNLSGISFLVNKVGDGWVARNSSGNIVYQRDYFDINNAIVLTTDSNGNTEEIVGLKPGEYAIYEIIDSYGDLARIGKSDMSVQLRDFYKADPYNYTFGCTYALKKVAELDRYNSMYYSDIDNTYGKFSPETIVNTRDYVTLQIDKCDQFLGKLGTQANKNNMKGIKFKVFQSGKGWIDKVNRNDEHSDIKYVKFEDAYELVTDANGTTEILRRLPNGGEYLIVETYIPDGTNGTDDLTPYYTLQTAYKDDPSQSSPGVYEIFRNYIATSSYSRAGENAWGNIKIKAICHKPSDKTSNTILVTCQAIKASSSNNGKYVWKARNLRDFITLQIYKQNERTESGKTVNDPLNDVKFAILEETSSSSETNRDGSWITANKDGKYNKTKISSYNYPSQSAANDVLLRSEGKTYSGVFLTGEKPKTYKANGYTRVILNIPLKPGQKYSIFEIDANTYNYLYKEGTFKFKGNNVQGRCIRSFKINDAGTIEETYNPAKEKTNKENTKLSIEGFTDRYDANGRKIFNVYVVKYTNKQYYGAFQIRKVDQLTQTPLKGIKIKIKCDLPGYGWLKIEKNAEGNYVVTDLKATYDQATELVTDADGYTPTVWKVQLWYSTSTKVPYTAFETYIPTEYRDYFALNADYLGKSPTNTDADLKNFDNVAAYDASQSGVNAINSSTGLNLKWSDCAKLLGRVVVEENIDKNDITKPVITDFKCENEQTFIDISGSVWQDSYNWIKNETQRDNEKNIGSNVDDDKNINNIKVRLMKRITDKTGKVHTIKVKETVSGSSGNGKYKFTKLKIKDLANYYIEFDYCGITYETVIPKYTTENIDLKLNDKMIRKGNKGQVRQPNSKTSKATETSDRTALNNAFGELQGEGKDKINYDGKNITLHYIKQDSGQVYLDNTYAPYLTTSGENIYVDISGRHTYNYLLTSTIDTFEDGNTTKSIIKYYYDLMAHNQTTYVFDGYERNYYVLLTEIPNLNLGLYLREQPSLSLQKDVYKADMSINGKTYTYRYDRKRENDSEMDPDLEMEEGIVGLKFDGKYSLPIYDADVHYEAENHDEELKATVTYKIKLQNSSFVLDSKIHELSEFYAKDLSIKEIYLMDSPDVTNEELREATPIGIRELSKKEKTYGSAKGYASHIRFNEAIQLDNRLKENGTSIKYLYIVFNINKDAIKDAYDHNNTPSDLFNVVEIASYSVTKDNKKYAHVDNNSIPNNADISALLAGEKNGKKYTGEDDDDKAPGLKVIKPSQREVTGIVFEDTPVQKNKLYYDSSNSEEITYDNAPFNEKVDPGEERIGDGLYKTTADNNMDTDGDGNPNIDKPISGVKVKLVDSDGNPAKFWNSTIHDWESKDYVESDSEGKFNLTGFIPGNYQVEFVWGKDAGGKDVSRYKCTILSNRFIKNKNSALYDQEIIYESWYKDMWYRDDLVALVGSINYSDAMDDYIRRLAIDKLNLKVPDEAYAGLTTADGTSLLEKINEYIGYGTDKNDDNSLNYMHSKTAEIPLGVEKYGDFDGDSGETTETETEKLSQEDCTGLDYNLKNIDFGLIERPKRAMSVQKSIKSIKITTPDGMPVIIATIGVDGKINAIAGERFISGGYNLGYLYAQIDKNMQQAMKVEVEYEIKVSALSELDYDYVGYYLYGIKKDGTELKLRADNLYDYAGGATITTDSKEEDNWMASDITNDGYLKVIANKEPDSQTVTEQLIMDVYNKVGQIYDEKVIIQALEEMNMFADYQALDDTMNSADARKVFAEIYVDLMNNWTKDEKYKNYPDLSVEIIRALKLKNREIVQCNPTNILVANPYESKETRTGTIKVSKIIANGDEIKLDNDIEIASVAVDTNQKTGANADPTYAPLYDRAEYVTVTPAQGEDRDYIGKAIVGIGILTVLASGIILIKRHLNK